MNVLEAIETRRAIKHFDPEHEMPEEELKTLLQAGRLAPSAFNIQHTRFLVVKDPELRKKIQSVSWDQAQVTEASVLIVVCADMKAWEKDPARYWRNAPEEVKGFMVGAIGQYYANQEQVQRDEAFRSCGLAAQNLMLAAKELGYESCPMDGFDFDAVGELIRLPEDHIISMFVVVGKGTQPAWERTGPLPEEEQILYNTFEG
jgi:nitroreductase